MDLIRWNPFGEFNRMREDLQRMYPDNPLMPGGVMPWSRMQGLSVDVRESENEIIISAEIPGVDADEIDITVNETHVILSGEFKRGTDQENEGYRISERRYGTFNRTISLPVEVKPDEATAEYKNGVLEIRMNKSEHGRTRSRKLKINKQEH
jgi:HSP20 family protein